MKALAVFEILIIFFSIVTSNAHAQEKNRKVTSIVRHQNGDYFSFREETDNSGGSCNCPPGGVFSVNYDAFSPDKERCQCVCPSGTPTLRDDTLTCVDYIGECLLAEFVSLVSRVTIPHVYLPVKGQLVNPRAEVALMGLTSSEGSLLAPICVVIRAQKLTPQGWQMIINTTDKEPPFRLHRNGGRTYLRWIGDTDTRHSLEGHLVLVSLRCRDTSDTLSPQFSPCVAFRTAGSVHYVDPKSSSPSEGAVAVSSVRNWLIGGAAVAIAIVFYLLTVFSIVIVRRKNAKKEFKKIERGSSKTRAPKFNYLKTDSVRSSQRRSSSTSLFMEGEMDDKEDIVELAAENQQNIQEEITHIDLSTTDSLEVPVRPQDILVEMNSDSIDDIISRDETAGTNLSVVEEIIEGPFYFNKELNAPEVSRERIYSHGSQIYMSTHDLSEKDRRKLLFNPSYFEPNLLQEPPPAAIDFLDKIRNIVNAAKEKMKNKSFRPSLNDIPEEDGTSHYQSRPQSRTTVTFSEHSVISAKTATSSMKKSSKWSQHSKDRTIGEDSLTLDSLDISVEDNKTSTLRRIAKRVSEKGSSFVSEIIKTFDMKNKYQNEVNRKFDPETSVKPVKNHVERLIKVHTNQERSSNLATKTNLKIESNDIIKPSLFRSLLNEEKQVSGAEGNSFENFRQEMIATFTKIKTGEEKILSPSLTTIVGSNEVPSSKEFESSGEQLKIGEGKVRKWLEDLESGDMNSSIEVQSTYSTAKSKFDIEKNVLGLESTSQEPKFSSIYEEISLRHKNMINSSISHEDERESDKDSLENFPAKPQKGDIKNIAFNSERDNKQQATKLSIKSAVGEKPNIKPPLPPKQSQSPESIVSKLSINSKEQTSDIPKTDTFKPPLPTKSKNLHTVSSMPSKTKKISELLSNDGSDQDELSDSAAEAILHGLQSKSTSIPSFSHSFRLNTNQNSSMSHSFKRSQTLRSTSFMNGKVKSPKQEPLTDSGSEASSSFSHMSEERISGQFILAPERKSPASSHRSFPRSITRSSSRSNPSSGKDENINLCQCAKTELEKHFIEKDRPNSDNVKKSWRKVVDEDSSTPDGVLVDEIPDNKRQKCKKCTKLKVYESDYQSCGTLESIKSDQSSLLSESSCTIDMEL